jgi:CDP-glucose 4,6-dehydratase
VDLEQGLRLTVDWYKALQRGHDLRQLSLDQLDHVVGAAQPV